MVTGSVPADPLRCEDADRELAVGEVAVAATVSPVDGRADARNVVEGREPTRALQVVHQRVTLGVDVGPDVVRDLPRGVAHADATVEGRRADPHGPPAVGREIRAPEADVVALACARADLLLDVDVPDRAPGWSRESGRRRRFSTV